MTECVAPPPDEPPPFFRPFVVIIGAVDLSQREFQLALDVAYTEKGLVTITEPVSPGNDTESRQIQVLFPPPPLDLHLPD